MSGISPFIVRHWPRAILNATRISVGILETGKVGIDLVAKNGATFGRGHLDVEAAEVLHRNLGAAIIEAKQRAAA